MTACRPALCGLSRVGTPVIVAALRRGRAAAAVVATGGLSVIKDREARAAKMH